MAKKRSEYRFEKGTCGVRKHRGGFSADGFDDLPRVLRGSKPPTNLSYLRPVSIRIKPCNLTESY